MNDSAIHSTCTITWRRDLKNAPTNKKVFAYGFGGWRIMTRDQMGQWRNVMGLPKEPPRLWADMPEVDLK